MNKETLRLFCLGVSVILVCIVISPLLVAAAIADFGAWFERKYMEN